MIIQGRQVSMNSHKIFKVHLWLKKRSTAARAKALVAL
jgi:hypothetical protein